MAGGGGEAPPVPPNADGGEFLLSLLRRPNHHPSPHQQQQSQFPSQFSPFITPRLQNQHPQPLGFDPAVAAVGPSLPILPHQLMQSNGRDVLSNTPPLWSHNLGFPQKNHAFPHPHGNQFQGNQYLSDDLQILGLSDAGVRAINNNNNNLIQHLPQQKQQLEQKLQFGSFSSAIPSPAEGLSKANLMREVGLESRDFNGLERSRHLEKQANSHSTNVGVRQPGASSGGWVNLHKEQHQNYRPPPPGFSNKPRGGVGGNWDHGGRRRELEKNMYREKGDCSELNNQKVRRNEGSVELRLTRPPVSNPHSDLDGEDGKDDGGVLDDLGEELVDSLLLEGESDGKKDKKQSSKEYRSDSRGQNILNQRMRMLKRQMQCRLDIDWLNAAFLSIYESLVPLEEETAKQKQFFMLLEKLVSKEWPEARLYLYGSCANSFGVSKSDIDVCLAIEDAEINKSKVLLKLADILQSDNFQKVQVNKDCFVLLEDK
ncbi:UTP:RNA URIDYLYLTRANSFERASE 1 [Salix koriyanagi]|uniref:UTP:RNA URIDYLYLTRANSFERASE 1 n=1 Tax=Salix koriyanagi TaxID=2511006 RepID=A0A9Q0Z671_9ROSI|nr:UTP:RNA URIDYLYLTRANSFERASE 1 [Salix koriyanagi]